MDQKKDKRINNDFYDDLGNKWNVCADHPIALLRAENQLRNPWIAQVIDQKFKRPVHVLDIGCGGGLLTNFLAAQGHRVSGIDLSSKSLIIAKGNDLTSSVDYREASAYHLPYPNHTFDAVSAMDLLEHVDDPKKVISEASRVLKKDGLFFFHTFNRNFVSWAMVIKGVEWCVKNTPSNMHVYSLFIKPIELQSMCFFEGLHIESFLGVRPDFKKSSFWKMLFTKKIPDDFSFTFTKSLTTGYSGYAVKML